MLSTIDISPQAEVLFIQLANITMWQMCKYAPVTITFKRKILLTANIVHSKDNESS